MSIWVTWDTFKHVHAHYLICSTESTPLGEMAPGFHKSFAQSKAWWTTCRCSLSTKLLLSPTCLEPPCNTRAVVNISFLASLGSGVYWLCLHFAISPHLDCNLVQQSERSVPSSAGLLECQHRSQPWAGLWHTDQSRVEAGYLHTHRKFPNAVWRAYFLSTASYQGSVESIITKPYFHKLLLH